MGDYIYALCRTYQSGAELCNHESIITLGLREAPIRAENFSLFKTKRDEYVARLEIIGRDNGIIFASIHDCLEKETINVKIPLDDLVEDSEIARPVR
jgi:hypothetical protein